MSNKLSFLLRAKHLKKNPPTIDEEVQNIIHNNHPGGTLINTTEKNEYEEDSETQTSDEEKNSLGASFNKVKSSVGLKEPGAHQANWTQDTPLNKVKRLVNFYNNITTKTNDQEVDIYSGPYEYKLFFENKAYPHSVNINKLIFNYKIKNNSFSKILYLSTGHSFAESSYLTDQGIKLEKTNQIENIFEKTNQNLFYSLDNEFDDFALLNFGGITLNNSNILKFNNKLLKINSVCRNMNIKFLENEIFIKNGNNIGETYAKTIINFDTDKFIKTNEFFTFKINGTIVIIKTRYQSGIVLKGINSKISKYNGVSITEEKNNEQLEYYFLNTIKELSNHEIFSNIIFDDKINSYYVNYKDTNSLTIVSLMGDSGSGFYRIVDNDNIEFVGINIGSCSMMVLKQSEKKYPNKIMWNNSINKLVFGGYIIEELHKSCQMLPIDKIENLIKRNLPPNIEIKEITV